MAHTVNVSKTLDGARFVILRVMLLSDGGSNELSNELILDPTTLDPKLDTPTSLTLVKAWYGVNGFAARFKWDSPQEQTLWVFTPGESNFIDFSEIGALNNFTGADGTGKLLLDTYGLASTNTVGVIILKFRKS